MYQYRTTISGFDRENLLLNSPKILKHNIKSSLWPRQLQFFIKFLIDKSLVNTVMHIKVDFFYFECE